MRGPPGIPVSLMINMFKYISPKCKSRFVTVKMWKINVGKFPHSTMLLIAINYQAHFNHCQQFIFAGVKKRVCQKAAGALERQHIQ